MQACAMVRKRPVLVALGAAFVLFAANPALAGESMKADAAIKPLRWLDPQAFAGEAVLPVPAAPGSNEERAEMAAVRAMSAGATPERHAQALADGNSENPRAFNAAVGRDLNALPATAHLLDEIEDEVESATDAAKRHFHRPRPYTVDPALAHCGGGKTGSGNMAAGKGGDRSYPSGHAAYGWSMAWVLADLIPDHRDAIFARARDFGYSRVICAVHYPSDLEAGHLFGVLAARALLADPRLAPDIAAARAELAGK